MEYTDEQLQELIQRESDKRVTSALQTAKGKWDIEHQGILTAEKTKWEQEIAERAKLSAEELAKKEFEDKLAEVSKRESEIRKKSNLLTAKESLSTAGVPKEQYEKLLDVLVNDNEDMTTANISKFIDVFNNTKTELETKIKSEYTKVTPPKQGNSSGGKSFKSMTMEERLELKKTNPDEFYKLLDANKNEFGF